MVSNASEDLPDPLSPVMTVNEFRGIFTLIFRRLCWRAPEIAISCNMNSLTVCVYCGREANRRPRNFFLKPFLSGSYSCPKCGLRWSRLRSFFFLFQKYAECPSCQTRAITRLAKKDRVDPMTLNPFRRMLVVFGAPIYHCTFCRIQFRDWRKADPDRRVRRSLS